MALHRAYKNLSLQARHLHLIAWLFSNRERCDGRLHMADFRSVAAETQLSELEAKDAAGELVQANLWQGRLPGPGYELLGFLAWNYSATEIDHKGELARERMRKGRAAKKGFSDSSKETELQATQATQERSIERSIERGGDTTGTDGLDATPEAIMKRQKSARRLREIIEEKYGHSVGSVS